jgi:H+/Na+-translocating ferredoxin:NAD+ oxidoreductase subunit C
MPSKSFFGPRKPAFRYELVSTALLQPLVTAMPATVTLLLPRGLPTTPSKTITVGAKVKTGQKLVWDDQPGPAVVCSVTGAISAIGSQFGDYGRRYTAVTIKTEKTDAWDDGFTEAAKTPDMQTLIDYLSTAPGGADLSRLADTRHPISTIVIYGGDTDLLVETNLYVLKSRLEAVEKGIRLLKELSGIENVIVAVPGDSFQNVDDHFPAQVKAVPDRYPMGQPLMVYYQLFGRILEQGQTFEANGVLFLRAEAVAAIGQAFTDGRVPVEKILTVMDKEGRKRMVSARIGTPIGAVLSMLDVSLNDRDRIIFGGPMTGTAVYSVEQPVQPDTDAIMVQERDAIILSSDYPCINCSRCIPACPAQIQVSMLVRFLEAGQYQEGADLYDLYSCVECGLCSYVCVSRIPILQYIKLAKFELARLTPAEEENE